MNGIKHIIVFKKNGIKLIKHIKRPCGGGRNTFALTGRNIPQLTKPRALPWAREANALSGRPINP